MPDEATGRRAVPVIILVDVSSSMHPVGISEANQGIKDYIDEMQRNEITKSSVFLTVITFSDTPQTLIEHQRIATVQAPTLSAEKSTGLDGGLREVNAVVKRHEADFRGGKEPLLILISDGNPTCSESAWRHELANLNSNPSVGRRPNGRPVGYRVLAGAGEQINDSVLEALRHDPEKSQVVRLRDQSNISEFFRFLITITAEAVAGQVKSQIPNSGK